MNNNENNLDPFVSDDYELSKKLNKVTKKSLRRITGKRNVYKYISSIAAIFIVYILLLNTSQDFRVFARNVPALEKTIDWFTFGKDAGLDKAVINEYKDFGPIVVQNEDYIVYLDHILIDEISINISSRFESKNGSDIEDMVVIISGNGFGAGSRSAPDTVDDKRLFKHTIPFNASELNAMIKDYHVINLYVGLVDRKTCISSDIDTVYIPIEEDDISSSRNYLINKCIETEYGDIYFEKFISSPTRSELLIAIEDKNGRTITGLSNLYFTIDGGEKIISYLKPSVYEAGKRTYLRYTINESIYYDEDYSVVFGFRGLLISYREDPKKVEISLDEKLPKDIVYNGDIISIDKITYNKNLLELELKTSSNISNLHQYSINVWNGEKKNKAMQTRMGSGNENALRSYDFTYTNLKNPRSLFVEIDYAEYLIENIKMFGVDLELIN